MGYDLHAEAKKIGKKSNFVHKIFNGSWAIFHPKIAQRNVYKNPGNYFFKKKFKVAIQSGIHKGPMQAFTALCRTKIVAATAI